MNRPPFRTCGSCYRFPVEAIALEARGECSIKGKAFAWSSPACPIFSESADRAGRKKVMDQLIAAQQPNEEPTDGR